LINNNKLKNKKTERENTKRNIFILEDIEMKTPISAVFLVTLLVASVQAD